jgi:hypothetical protein
MKSFFLFFSLSSVKEQPAWCRFTAKIWNVSTYGFVDKAILQQSNLKFS